MTPEQYVQDKTAKSGSSFYYAFLFLTPARRAAMTAFYAFCREIDDIVDEIHDPSVAAAKLSWWDQEVEAMFAGRGQHPVSQALARHLEEYHLEARCFHDIISGCRMDLQQTRYLDFTGLQRYCHLVAGVVGEVSARIFGQSQLQTTEYAHTLGQALQLTNILRDVGEDARRGRIYLPLDELQRFDVKAHEILKRDPPWGYSDRFSQLMHFQALRARELYEKAFALLPKDDRPAQKPGLMMGYIYRELLAELERQKFQVLHQRTSLTPLRKLWIALRTHWRG